ncbi:allantoicase [Streptomyces azureus]|uniref:Allantoicase n=1 Tax=Streptomyces azureus TaxID=146537 RepID=A0A0K8PPY1_STRAJ|nr:allantoicase [Streptomyces azureus]
MRHGPTPVSGHAANGFAVSVEQRFTHLRVNPHPDGGIAGLRVYGEVVPDPQWLATLGTFDVVTLENGGQAEDASNLFYSPATNTIQPGRSRKMDDGWETPPPRPEQRLDPLPACGPVPDPRDRDRHGVPEGQQRGLGVGVGEGRRGR